MSASKMIVRNLTYTVMVLIAFLFAVNFVGIRNNTSAAAALTNPIVGEEAEQENLGNEGIDDIGDILDSVVFDYAA